MSQIDDIVKLVSGVSDQVGIGEPEATSLVQELLKLMFGGSSGLSGFLDMFKVAGLGGLATSWIGGGPDAGPLDPQAAALALGERTIASLAEKIGVNSSVATAALAFVLPKLVGLLTRGGGVPASAPAAIAAFMDGAQPPMAQAAAAEGASGLNRYLLPGVAALLALGFLYHLTTGGQETAPAPVAATPPAAAPAPAPIAPAPMAPAPLAPAHFSFANDKGAISASGVVATEQERSSILSALKALFGDQVASTLGVDPHVAASPWIAKLVGAFDFLKTPGLTAGFDGARLTLGGALPASVLDEVLARLKAILGGELTYSAAPTVDFSSLKENFTGQDLVGVLNSIVVNFDTGSAVIDDTSKAVLAQAAAMIKKLPSSTVVGIGGYTDRTGDAAANVVLSQHRADAVRQALIDAGVAPSMLTAKGYGSADASSGGSSRTDRRIEFTVAQ